MHGIITHWRTERKRVRASSSSFGHTSLTELVKWKWTWSTFHILSLQIWVYPRISLLRFPMNEWMTWKWSFVDFTLWFVLFALFAIHRHRQRHRHRYEEGGEAAFAQLFRSFLMREICLEMRFNQWVFSISFYSWVFNLLTSSLSLWLDVRFHYDPVLVVFLSYKRRHDLNFECFLFFLRITHTKGRTPHETSILVGWKCMTYHKKMMSLDYLELSDHHWDSACFRW